MSPPAGLVLLRHRLSVERLAPYDAAGRGDAIRGLILYQWNTDISAAFYGLLQGVEVILRNALHDQLTTWHRAKGRPGFWFDDPGRILEEHRHQDVAEARRRIRRQGKVETPGRVVAELSFGFWRYLLSSRYEQTLWTPALRHAFPHLRPQRRRVIAQPVERLHRLRNRIAHHEPIHSRDLARDQADAHAIVAAICPYTRIWLASTSLVTGTLRARPP